MKKLLLYLNIENKIKLISGAIYIPQWDTILKRRKRFTLPLLKPVVFSLKPFLFLISIFLISAKAHAQAPATTYNTPNTFVYGAAITDLTPDNSAGGLPTGYTVAPALPAGLNLDPLTGVISGTPTAVVTGTYTITATNGSGSIDVPIDITVNPAVLTVSGLTASNKPYDGNATASFSGGSLNGVVGSDVVTLIPSGTFATKNVGTGIAVTSTSTLGGADAGNYTLTQPASLTANITAKALTLTGITANNKPYDGNTTASFTGGTLNGVVGSEVVNFTASGTFATNNVGTGITVTSTSTLGGADAGNYTLTQPAGLTANITAKALTLTGITANNKPYDGNTTASFTGGTLNGMIGSESVTFTPSGTFATKNAGTAIAVTSTTALGGADAGNYTLTQPSGLSADITAKALTVATPAATNKTYDGTTAATITGTLSGIVGSDVVTLNGTGTFASLNVGTGIAVTSTSTLGGADAGNYTLTQPTGLTANITAKALTVSPVTANNKTYDGTTAATITGTLVGIVGADAVTFNGTGTFASPNVGTGIAVTSTSTIGGAQAGNYTLTQPTGLTANITTGAALTITGMVANNKVYDGTTAATFTGGTLNGVVPGDVVTFTPSGTFATANVGNNIAVTSTITLGGAQAGNYTLTQPTGLTANITAKALTLTSPAAANKVYNGTTAATITGTLNGIVGSDVVTLNGTGTFASLNVGAGIAVTSTSTLGGADAGNYTLTQPTGLTANITAKALTVSPVTANNKTYDGTTAATITGTLVGIVGADAVTFNGTGTFASPNVGTGIAVTSTSTIGGAQAGNYTLTQPTGLTANITSGALTITGMVANNKVYDGTTAATFTGGTLNGVTPGDVVTFTPSGTFATANVGNNIAVTSTTTLGGAQAGNYTLTQPTGLTANITAKALTLTSPAAANKVYDGTTAATISGTLNGVIAGDIVTLVGTGTFATKNVGTGIAVTSTSTLGGAQGGNYTLTQPTGLTANITAKALTIANVSVTPASGKTYDGTTAASLNSASAALVGVIAGDLVTLVGTPTGTYATANAGNGIVVTVSGYSLGGSSAGNYTLTPLTLSGKISKAPLTITPTPLSKVYGTTEPASVSGQTTFTATGLQNGETIGTVTINYGVQARSAGENVGTYSTNANYSTTATLPVGGTFNISNYYSVSSPTGTFTVTPAPFYWVGQTNGNWRTTANWYSAGIQQNYNYPGKTSSADVVYIGVSGGPAGTPAGLTTPTIVLDSTLTVASINFGNSGSAIINLNPNAGISISTSGGFTLNSGTLTVNMVTNNPTLNIGGNYTASSSGDTFNWGGSNPMTITGTTINAGTFNHLGSGLVTMTGATTNTGTINQTSTGNMVFTGDFTNSGSTSVFKQTGSGTATFSGALTNQGAFTQGAGAITVTGTLTNSATGNLTLGSAGFTVSTGNYVNSGTFTAGTGTVFFTNLLGNQKLFGGTGAGTVFNKVSFSSATGPIFLQSGVFGISSIGIMTLTGSNTTVSVISAASLTIYSTATSSGTVAAIPTGCSVTGTVNVQRYITGGAGYRGYRLVSSPVNAGATFNGNTVFSMNYIAASIPSTGANGVAGGFTKVGNPTFYLFREDKVPDNSTFVTGNFRGISDMSASPSYSLEVDGSGFNLPVGTGILTFFRGSTSTVNPFVTTTVPLSAIITATGTLNQQSYTAADWYNPAPKTMGYSLTSGLASVEGFNLVGNPYASSIDWDTWSSTVSTAGIYGPNTAKFVYLLNPTGQTASGNYGVYSTSTGGINNATHVIPSGVGFFIQAISAGASLKFTEAAKINTQVASPNLFMGTPPVAAVQQFLRLKLATDSINSDETLINFDSATKAGYDITEDARYRMGLGQVNLASISGDNVPLAINQLPLAIQGDTIPLRVGAKTSGTYTLNMTAIKGIPQFYDVWLKDAFTKDSVNMRNSSTYSFTIDKADSTTFGEHRFKLALVQNPALAYKLLSFGAEKTGKVHGVQLYWTTANEQTYTNFTVERSNDNGVTFNVAGGMHSTGAGTYSLLDNGAQKGHNLYRLKQEDYNNAITYSNSVDIQFQDNGNNKSNHLSLFPNPAINTINLTIEPNSQGNTTYNIRISNSSGVVIKSAAVKDTNWQNNVSDLLTGTYLIEVTDAKNNSVIGQTKFVKL